MPSRDITDCCPLLQEFWFKLKTEYEAEFYGRELFLTCTARSVQEQQELFAKNKPGYIITRCDGVKNKSKHNEAPALAFDLAVRTRTGPDAPRVQWDEAFYRPLGAMIKRLGYEGRVRWGGTFSFKDYPHFEVAS